MPCVLSSHAPWLAASALTEQVLFDIRYVCNINHRPEFLKPLSLQRFREEVSSTILRRDMCDCYIVVLCDLLEVLMSEVNEF